MPPLRASAMRESFPKFDLVEATPAMERRSDPLCIFEQGRRMMGQLFIRKILDTSIIVRYIFASEHVNCNETEVVLPTVRQEVHTIFKCPGCMFNRWSLYYRDQWKCADCHGLLYRSQLVDKEVQLWEERDRLSALLKAGRPKGMHNSTYAHHRLRLAELERLLRCRPRKYASDVHDLIVRERWVPGTDADLWFLNYTVRGGFIVKLEPYS